MKTLLPWLVAVLALGAAGVLYQSTNSKSVELAKLQADVQELQTLRTENAELKNQQVPVEELARLRKDNQDLLRLRNEIRQARDDKKQLAQQAQSALSEVQRAQAQAQAAQMQVQSLSTNLQAARYGLAATPEQQAANTCINHLRQLDGAKQQWALENKKTEEATPTIQDIAAYLLGNLIPHLSERRQIHHRRRQRRAHLLHRQPHPVATITEPEKRFDSFRRRRGNETQTSWMFNRLRFQ